MPGVLTSTTVVDLTQALAGPFCTMILGDLGAEVIKVERPRSGDQARGWGPPFIKGESAYFLATNRNKRSLTLNLKNQAGLAILHRLLERADVLVTNFPRKTTLASYGLDYPSLEARYPRLVVCSITGYGMTGPDAEKAGYDIVAQGASGLMSITGQPGGEPTKFGASLADMSAAVYGSLGILGALLARERTGRGQFIDISLLESQMSWLNTTAVRYFLTGEAPQPEGNAHPIITPFQAFKARDRWIVVGVGTDEQWHAFCQVLEENDGLGKDPRFASNRGRREHRQELIPLLEGIIRGQPAAFWLEKLEAAGIPCGPVNSVEEALSDPQVLARGMVAEMEHPLAGPMQILGSPLHLSQMPVSFRRPAPLLGEHTQEILEELGCSVEEIGHLREEGIV